MAFCQRYGLRIPILQAPMVGSCPVSLPVAVADAGGNGRYGCPFIEPECDRQLGRRVSGAEPWTFSTESLDSGTSTHT